MNIELRSGAMAVAAAPTWGTTAPITEFGSMIPGLGPEIIAPSLPINEGPPLEGVLNMPYIKIDNLNLKGAERFNPIPDIGGEEGSIAQILELSPVTNIADITPIVNEG